MFPVGYFYPSFFTLLFTLLLSMINFRATRKSSFVSSFFENVFSPSMVVTLSKHLKSKTTKRTDTVIRNGQITARGLVSQSV